MTVNELIQQLKAQGVDVTPDQIEQTLGSVEYLTADDIPSILEMFSEAKPSKRRSGSIAKTPKTPAAESASIQKLDHTNLPEVATLTNNQVDSYIAEIEAMDQTGQVVSDELVAFLIDLYDRRDQAIQLADGAAARFREQDARLVRSMANLNTVLAGSVDELKNAHDLMEQIAAGGARLGDNFRTGTQRWRDAADRFAAHTAQPSSPDQSAA